MTVHSLWLWEERECADLKSVLAKHNALRPKAGRVTQRRIAEEMRSHISNVNRCFRGLKPVDVELAEAVFRLTGIPIENFSPRIAQEIKERHDRT